MAQQKPHDVNEPSRRRLLKGIGALGGALAITGGCPVAHAAKRNVPGAHTRRAPGKAAILWPASGGHSDAAAGFDDAGGLRCAGG